MLTHPQKCILPPAFRVGTIDRWDRLTSSRVLPKVNDNAAGRDHLRYSPPIQPGSLQLAPKSSVQRDNVPLVREVLGQHRTFRVGAWHAINFLRTSELMLRYFMDTDVELHVLSLYPSPVRIQTAGTMEGTETHLYWMTKWR